MTGPAWALWLSLAAIGFGVTADSRQAQAMADVAGRAQADPAQDPPITVVVTQQARPGCGPALAAFVRDNFQVFDRSPGHLGTDFLRPATADGSTTVIVVRFDRTSHYRQWLDSPERAQWQEGMARYTDGQPQYANHAGLEASVALPDGAAGPPPEKYKTVAVTWLAVFPMAVSLSEALAPLTLGWYAATRTALLTGILVPSLNYSVMPAMTWLFHDWLYAPAPDCEIRS